MDPKDRDRVEELLALHQAEVGIDPMPNLTNLNLRRKLVLECALLLTEQLQMSWLSIESQFIHVDEDCLRLHETLSKFPEAENEEEVQFEVNELWYDVSSMLAQVLSLSREV